MRNVSVILGVLLLCLPLTSCEESETPTPPTTGTVQGQVTNVTGDTLIVGAIVTTSPATSSVSTNSQGEYTISNIPAGQYTLTASKGGFHSASTTIAVTGGRTTTANIHLSRVEGNRPPAAPSLSSPIDGAINQATTITLSWTCTDPDGDALMYNVYFDRNTPPSTVASRSQTNTSMSKGGLDTSTTYYWKVIAKDHHADSASSSIWSFTTRGDTMGSLQGRVTDALSDTAIAGALVTTIPPTSSVITNAEGNYIIARVLPGQYLVTASKAGYNSGDVTVNVTAGHATSANLHLVRNKPPAAPSIISPADGAVDQPTTITLSWTCSDPDGDALTYDVYFDNNTPPNTLVAPDQSSTSNVRNALDTATTYYWRVVAKDSRGAQTSSNIWSFTTFHYTIPTLGMVAYYPFSGDTEDESGNNNSPTIVGHIQFVQDRFGSTQHAFYFDGTTRLFLQGSIDLHDADASISAWIIPERYTGDPTDYAAVAIYDRANERSIRLWVDGNGMSGLPVGNKIVGQSASSNGYDYSSYFFTNNTANWMHAVVVIRIDGIELWIDGEMKSNQGINGGGSYFNGGLGIGGNQSDNTQLFQGHIDDVRIYNRALTDQEIQSLYHEGGW